MDLVEKFDAIRSAILPDKFFKAVSDTMFKL